MGSTSLQNGWDKVWGIGTAAPEPYHDFVHNFVARTVQSFPDCIAVSAWDGEFTYGELDDLASKLSGKLLSLGLISDRQRILPLCFEKSKWTSVAVLGALKAGAGFVLLDAEIPQERLARIVQQVQAKTIVTSCAKERLSRQLGTEVVVVGPEISGGWDAGVDSGVIFEALTLSPPSPSSTAYVVFTSGSTGTPKGCVISHQNLCSALHYQVHHLGFTSSSRVFDFAAYSFDVSIHNLFATWAVGGCVCVPSDADRRDNLEVAIASSQATIVNLTPTVARLLSPAALPCLRTMILLGEMVTERDAMQWWGRMRVINTYGPTECTSLTTINGTMANPEMLRSIGVGVGAVTWIVDPENHHVLLPWGQTGELLIEGPIVGQGYLNDEEKTAAVFVEDPEWLLMGHPELGIKGRQGRLYKTGDLARYDDQGQLLILGRKDNQVKIRGNRVELGEVEYRIHDCVRDAAQVVVETVKQDRTSAGECQLVAFLKFPEQSVDTAIELHDQRGSSLEASPRATLYDIEPGKAAELARYLPGYMIPSLYFVVNKLPMTSTGKTDRKVLRELGQSWCSGRMDEEESPHRIPHGETECQLQQLFSTVLQLPLGKIAADANFLHLGGDSISAMRLVSVARKACVKLTVADIIGHPVLSDMAKRMQPIVNLMQVDGSINRHAGLVEAATRDAIILKASSLSPKIASASRGQIDVLPLTDAQEAFILDGISNGRQYVDYYFLDLGSKVDLQRLKDCCGKLLHAFPILRAMAVLFENRHWMVVPDASQVSLDVHEGNSSLDEATTASCLHDISEFQRHQPIVHFRLLRNDSQGSRLIMRISHAQYDAVSIDVIFKALMSAYLHGQSIKVVSSFADYLAHTARQKPKSEAYWQNLLKGCKHIDFSSTFTANGPTEIPPGRPVPFRVQEEVPCPVIPSDITMASFLSAAWAIFLGQSLDGPGDILFARLVNGRNAALPAVEDVVGCCINMVPVRVHIDGPSTPASAVVRAVQDQFVAMGEADALGFWDIARACGGRDDGGGTCSWMPDVVSRTRYAPDGNAAPVYTCTMHANVDERLTFEMEDGFESQVQRFENEKRLPFFLYLVTYPRGDNLGVEIYGHSQMVSVDGARSLLAQLCPLITGLAKELREDEQKANAGL